MGVDEHPEHEHTIPRGAEAPTWGTCTTPSWKRRGKVPAWRRTATTSTRPIPRAAEAPTWGTCTTPSWKRKDLAWAGTAGSHRPP